MATVRQVIQFDEEEANTLRSAVNGRAVTGVMEEVRTVLNQSIQPPEENDSSNKRTRITSSLKPGAEVTHHMLNTLTSALNVRKELLFQLSEVLGDQAEQTKELLEAHEQAETVLRTLTEQLPPDPGTPEPSATDENTAAQ